MKIKIKTHPYFKREQYDIHTVNYISISQAVLGGKVKIKTLYGDVQVNIEPGTNDGDTKKLLNYVKILQNFNFQFSILICFYFIKKLGNHKTRSKSKPKRTPFYQV